MNKLLITLLFFLIGSVSISQSKNNFTVVKKGTVNVREAIKSDLKIKVDNLNPPSPDGNSTRSMLLKKKVEIEKKYSKLTPSRSSSRAITLEDTLKVGKSFLSNSGARGTPSDNSMAISNDGIVVSSFNSAIFIRDTENDTTLGELSLNQFSAQIGMNNDNFDPKMIYDPEQDKFILIYLAGRTIVNSNIVVCYSQTNDPMGNWNVYSLSGNPLGDSSWSDYPAISMTKEDIFITINLLLEGGSWQTSFKQTVIWQINKADGYSGAATQTPTLWSGIKDGGGFIRNMHPVRGGFDLKSTTQYFLSNRNFATQSDSIYLMKIDNTQASGLANLTVKLLHADQDYYLSTNGKQSARKLFVTNDSRVLGGIIENGKIQFVQNSLDPETGRCAIYHGVISDLASSPVVKAKFIAQADIDYGYPNIVYGGLIPNEDKSVIGFNHTSETVPAGFSSVYFDGENYSSIKMIKKGESRVQYGFSNYIRWGDYFGMQRKYNETCKVWASGYFGKSNTNYTWVSEVILPGDCYDTIVPLPFLESTMFPNPSETQSEIHFTLKEEKEITIDLVANNGSLIRKMFEDKGKKGENRLSFDTENLRAGIYFVRIYSGNEVILVKKLVKR